MNVKIKLESFKFKLCVGFFEKILNKFNNLIIFIRKYNFFCLYIDIKEF